MTRASIRYVTASDKGFWVTLDKHLSVNEFELKIRDKRGYMVYVNDKPILLVCDNSVYVKILPCLDRLMNDAERGFPYDGAKEHYILDIDNTELSRSVVIALEAVTPIPKPRKKKGQVL